MPKFPKILNALYSRHLPSVPDNDDIDKEEPNESYDQVESSNLSVNMKLTPFRKLSFQESIATNYFRLPIEPVIRRRAISQPTFACSNRVYKYFELSPNQLPSAVNENARTDTTVEPNEVFIRHDNGESSFVVNADPPPSVDSKDNEESSGIVPEDSKTSQNYELLDPNTEESSDVDNDDPQSPNIDSAEETKEVLIYLDNACEDSQTSNTHQFVESKEDVIPTNNEDSSDIEENDKREKNMSSDSGFHEYAQCGKT